MEINNEYATDILYYSGEYNSQLNKLIDGPLILEFEKVKRYLGYSDCMNEFFDIMDYEFEKPDSTIEYSEEELNEKIDKLRSLFLSYKSKEISKDGFNLGVKENHIDDAFYSVNRFLLKEGYEIEMEFLSTAVMCMISDKSGFTIDELFIYSEVLDPNDYGEAYHFRKLFDNLESTSGYFKNDEDYKYNAYSNDVLSTSYDDIIYFMVEHLDKLDLCRRG